MENGRYEINLGGSGLDMKAIQKWFLKNGFNQAKFENSKVRISTHWLEQTVTFKLTQLEGFDTFYKEAFGGSLIVFEISTSPNSLIYNCYCPLYLFGIWTLKLSFKEKALKIFQYREQGWKIHKNFNQFIAQNVYP